MLIAIGVGGTIGASIFTILGFAAGMAGPAVVLSFLIGGLLTILVGLNYSELSSTFPEAGGGYTFAKKAYGGMPAFLTGWLMVFANIIYGSLSALGFAQIVSFAIGFPILASIPLALATLAAFALLNLQGVEETGKTQLILVVVLVAGLILFVAIGSFFVSPSNLFPFAPSGWVGVLEATSFTFVAYFGFEAIATVSGEAKEPGRHLAIATIASILICTAIYCAVSWVAIGIVGGDALARSPSPLMLVGAVSLGVPGMVMVGAVGAIGTLTSLNAAVIASTRILFALGRDGFLPKEFTKLNRQGIPHIATVVAVILMAIFISTGIIDFIAHVADFNIFLALILVCLSLVYLRRKRGVLERPFRSPVVLAIISIVVLAFFLLFLNNVAIAAGSALVFFGIVLYIFEIAPRPNRSVALGGCAAGAGYALIVTMGIGGWTLILQIGGFSLQLVPLLFAGGVILLFSSFLCVVPLGRIFEAFSFTSTASPATAKKIGIIKDTVAATVAVFGPIAMVIFFLVFHGFVMFPGIPLYTEGYRFLLLLSLGGFSLITILVGLFLWQRRYVPPQVTG